MFLIPYSTNGILIFMYALREIRYCCSPRLSARYNILIDNIYKSLYSLKPKISPVVIESKYTLEKTEGGNKEWTIQSN